MNLTPSKIYENYRNKVFDKTKTVDLLITLIENADDDIIRRNCLEILNKLDFNYKKIFKILENLFISEPNEDIRHSAAKIIRTKFLNKALSPFLWALQHESSYNCLITIIKSLEEISDDRIDTLLKEEIKKINNKTSIGNLIPLFTENFFEQKSHTDLAEILINFITIKYLTKKFNKIAIKFEKGLVSEVDFSNVDNQVIYWRDRDALQNLSDIIGIENLKNLKKIGFFPLEWVTNNEFTYRSAIALIEALEKLNNDTAKLAIISQIKSIDDNKFNTSINVLVQLKGDFDNLSLSKLSDIFRNFLTISFLKRRYPSLEFNVERGEITSIYIEGIPLITISEFIKYFRSLHSLTIKGCRLSSLPEFIGSFKFLELLDLEGNNLKTIPKSISSLKSLKILNLSNNRLEKVPYSMGFLPSLQSLNLENNNLSDLPRSIGYQTSLKILNAGKNNLKKIPSSIGSLKTLESLNLKSNKIKYLPKSIGLLSSLEYLNMDNNSLTKIPDSINSITSLKTLSLEENKISFLPESMELLKSIEVLKLGWNNLYKLPNSIGSLVKLKYLRLINNHLSEFHDSICSLSLLEFFDASGNKIKKIPVKIGKLKLLKVLKISDNRLKKLPDSINSLISLEILNLSGNKIVNLPASIGLLRSLKELWLNGNKLKYLPQSIGELKSLIKLNLNNNRLIFLPKSIVNIQSLEDISRESNRIVTVFDYPIISKKYTVEGENLSSQFEAIGKRRSFKKLNSKDGKTINLSKSTVNIKTIFDYPIISRKLTVEQ